MLDPVSIIAAISAANGAYKTLKTAASNASEAWGAASKFLEAKAEVDLQAKTDKAEGKQTTQAFLASIDLKRKQMELDSFIIQQCEGWVIAEWQAHKKTLEDQVWQRAQEAKIKARQSASTQDNDVRYAITALVVLTGIISFIFIIAGDKIKAWLSAS